MAMIGCLRSLVLGGIIKGNATLGAVAGREALSSLVASASYATGPEALSRKDVAYLLDSRDDPEVNAAVGAYLKTVYAGGKAAATAPEETFALASKVEKKYIAAQVVAQGVQNIALPLSYDGKDAAPVKRFVSQLVKLATKAGFEDPATEVEKRLAEKALTAESVKEFLGRIQPYTSADFHASLSEALAQVEAETNSSVSMDSASEGYKKFAKKVEAIATASKIPWKTLVDVKKPSASAEASDAAKTAYLAWAQSARLADAKAEIEVLKSEAVAVLDKHLSKTAEQAKAEQAASLAALQKKLEAAKGAKWAVHFQEDLKNIAWFDSAVAANPAAGPKATA